MTQEQIQKLIARKNDDIQYRIQDQASSIIDTIMRLQSEIIEKNKQIVELKTALKDLSAQTINPSEII